jgi:predicted transcriptional regulator
MTTRDELLHLIDALSEDALDELRDYAHWLAEEEDEPLTADELDRVREGEAEIARGEYVTLEELRRKLVV